MSAPAISLTVEGMRHTLKVALSKYTAELDQMVQEAVDKYCEPENIRFVVSQAASHAIDAAVKEGIKGFFGYGGKGRKYILEEVERRLTEEMEFTAET
jgi:hypothetical protein